MSIAFATILLTGFVDADAAILRDGMDYRISVDKSLERLAVELCFADGAAPRALLASAALANGIDDTTARLADGSTWNLQVRGRTIELPPGAIDCVAYVVRIPTARSGDWRSGLNAHNGAIAVTLDRVLVRPNNPGRWHQTRLRFFVPPGVRVSAPGTPVAAQTGEPAFELLDRPSAWSGTLAFGRLTPSVIAASDARIRLAVVGDTDPETAAMLQAWVAGGVAAITTLYGRFPVSDLQVLVFPIGPTSEPVPWGEVARGGGDAVHLYVDSTRSAAELRDNWVLPHELSHLIHPYVSAADAWLPEGIASYFQNVLRARSGLIEEQLAWEKLDAGFKRGVVQFSRDRTLARDTRLMMRQRQYMRVYWSGAAIALIGDVRLRQQSHGAVSLDTVFENLSRCCLPSRRRWAARELMAKMDDIAGFEVFLPLYERYVMRPEFPDLDDTYRHLGLIIRAQRLELSDDAAARSLRAAIMTGHRAQDPAGVVPVSVKAPCRG